MSGLSTSNFLFGRDSDSSQFMVIPRFLFRDDLFADLSDSAKVLYILLLDQTNDFEKNCSVDEEGMAYIHYTVGEVQKQMHCSKPKALGMMAELEKYKMIRKVQEGRGKPARIYLLDCAQYMESETERPSGKASPSASPAHTECNNRLEGEQDQDWASKRFRVVRNTSPSRVAEGGSKILHYTEQMGRDPHRSAGAENRSDHTRSEMGTLSFAECMEKVHEKLEYDLLIVRNPMQTRLIDNICDLIVETLLSRKDTIRCAGEDMKTQIVQQRLMRLGSQDIERIIEGMKEAGAAGKVRNPKNYLLTVLYNEPITSDVQYMMDVNSDLAGVSMT